MEITPGDLLRAASKAGIQTRTQADRRYGRAGNVPQLNPRTVFWGDSITEGALAGSATPPAAGQRQIYGAAYDTLAGILANGKIRFVHNAGVGGERTDSILARFARDVEAYDPGVVVLLMGTNDIGNTAGLTLAQTKANLLSAYQRIMGIGALPVAVTIPPKIASSALVGSAAAQTQLDNLLEVNEYIRDLARQYRLPLVDSYRLLADPLTGRAVSRYTLTIDATGGSYVLRVKTKIISGVAQSNPSTGGVVNGVTASVAYNASAATLQNALNAVANVGTGTFAVEGADGGPYTIRSRGGYPFDLTVETNSLTGGAGTATFSNVTAYLIDGVHPNIDGQRVLANGLVSALSAYPSPPSLLPFVNDNNNGGSLAATDASNCLRNGLFAYNTGGNPSFWTLNTGAHTYTTPSADVGVWLQGVTTGTGVAYLASQILKTGSWSVGDRIAFTGRIQVEGVEGTAGLWTVRLESSGSYWAAASGVNYNVADGTFYVEMVVPSGTTSITAGILTQGYAGFTVRVSQIAVRNLTALGI